LLLSFFITFACGQGLKGLLRGKAALGQKSRLAGAIFQIRRRRWAESLGFGLYRPIQPSRVQQVNVLARGVFVYAALRQLAEDFERSVPALGALTGEMLAESGIREEPPALEGIENIGYHGRVEPSCFELALELPP
jgi:hypothetical protein